MKITRPLTQLAGTIVAALAVFALFAAFALFAHAQGEATMAVSIESATSTAVSAAPINSTVNASVTLASTTGAVVTGTVDFILYGNTSCSGVSSVQSAVALATTTAGSIASSATTTVGANGLSYRVHFNGSSAYPAEDSVCTAVSAIQPPATTTQATSTGDTSGSSATSTQATSTTPVPPIATSTIGHIEDGDDGESNDSGESEHMPLFKQMGLHDNGLHLGWTMHMHAHEGGKHEESNQGERESNQKDSDD